MTEGLQVLVTGILVGAVYGSAAFGLSVIWGVLRILNFAQADFMMLAMFGTYLAVTKFGLSPIVAIPIMTAAFFGLGVLVNRFLIEAILDKPEITHLLYTAGLGLVLQNLALLVFRSDPRSVPFPPSAEAFVLGNIYINRAQLLGFLVSLAAVATIAAFQRSSVGVILRAIVDNRSVASMLGIDVTTMYRYAFGLGLALTALAGVLISLYHPVAPTVGASFIVTMFVVVVLGGMGNVWGTFLAGLVVGVVQQASGRVLPVIFQDAVVFAVFVLVLVFRSRHVAPGRLG